MTKDLKKTAILDAKERINMENFEQKTDYDVINFTRVKQNGKNTTK